MVEPQDIDNETLNRLVGWLNGQPTASSQGEAETSLWSLKPGTYGFDDLYREQRIPKKIKIAITNQHHNTLYYLLGIGHPSVLNLFYKLKNKTNKFDRVLFRTVQLYASPTCPEHLLQNHRLLDKMVSSLLWTKIDFKEIVLQATPYIAHLCNMKDHTKEVTKQYLTSEQINTVEEFINENKVQLEGFRAHEYFQVHLRLFFQKIVEITLSRGTIDERIIKEFLCQLETGWLIQQLIVWFNVTNMCPIVKSEWLETIISQVFVSICL